MTASVKNILAKPAEPEPANLEMKKIINFYYKTLYKIMRIHFILKILLINIL